MINSLDEAIKHCNEVAERLEGKNGYAYTDATCEECAKEHRQLAEWLKELQRYRKVRTILSQNRIATDRYGEVVLWDDIKRVLTEVKADEDNDICVD